MKLCLRERPDVILPEEKDFIRLMWNTMVISYLEDVQLTFLRTEYNIVDITGNFKVKKEFLIPKNNYPLVIEIKNNGMVSLIEGVHLINFNDLSCEFTAEEVKYDSVSQG